MELLGRKGGSRSEETQIISNLLSKPLHTSMLDQHHLLPRKRILVFNYPPCHQSKNVFGETKIFEELQQYLSPRYE